MFLGRIDLYMSVAGDREKLYIKILVRIVLQVLEIVRKGKIKIHTINYSFPISHTSESYLLQR